MSLNNKFIIGCAQSDINYGINKNKNFKEVFQESLKLGFKYFDTSPSYKNSQKYLKEISQNKNYKIISKIKCEGEVDSNFRNKVIDEIESIFKSNNLSRLYGLLIHDPLLPLHSKKWKIVSKILGKYKKNGLIKKIGISLYSTFELENIIDIFTPDIIQLPLNVFNQNFLESKTLLNLKKKKIELHARSIFLQGSLLQKYHKLDPKFKTWENDFLKWSNYLNRNKINNLRACLIFALKNNTIDKFVIGLDNKKQLLELKNEYKIISKNKKFLKHYNFEHLKSEDVILGDPRYWNSIKKSDKTNYTDWIKVKKKVLNGGMLLSKRPNQFLPGGWPTFYKKAKGCHIWDKSGRKYLDFSLMGVGTNILGYSNSKINKDVIKNINDGSISTLNSYLDHILSEKLIELHTWADLTTFARTGGEANAIAIRIARIFSKRDEIAICGYHGWHDWYLSTNLKNKNNLDEIHLSGLSTIGIPKKLKGLTHPFKYNDIKSFKKILNKNPNIGTVFMEVERNEKPKKNFLKQIRKITKNKNIVLIFDECTSGFRETYGGLHKKYKVHPDLAVFGKSLGNGIPITAVIGKKEIMNAAKKSFISSTFWTDGTGPAAAISTLNEMARVKSWKKISNIGKKIKKKWTKLSRKHQIKIKVYGIDALPSFHFEGKMNLYFKTFLTQEMLKKNILSSNSVYCCVQHEKYLNIYFKELDKVFFKIKKIINSGSLTRFLKHPVSLPGFSRLN